MEKKKENEKEKKEKEKKTINTWKASDDFDSPAPIFSFFFSDWFSKDGSEEGGGLELELEEKELLLLPFLLLLFLVALWD